MTLDLTTFILQILNFLVLLWLLHRFVYAPLRAAMQKRQAAAAAAEAALQQKMQALDAERAALQTQFAQIEQAKQAAEAELSLAIAQERAKRLASLEKELTALRERGEARLQAQLSARQADSALQLRKQVDTVLRQHLARLATPGLEAVLVEQFLDDLKALEPTLRAELQALVWQDPLDISTAYPLDPILEARLASALTDLRGAPVQLRWKQDARLFAGLRVGLDGKELELSLAHTLELLPPGVRHNEPEPVA